MKAIVAVGADWGIGCENKLLFNIPADMLHFIKATTGKVVVMGYKTLLSFPSSKPLKNRTNIVLTTKVKNIEGAIVCNSIEQLAVALQNYPKDDVHVIGGESVYKQLLPYCSEVIVTKVNEIKKADTFYPNLDKNENFEVVSEECLEETDAKIYTYKNKKVKSLNEIKR